MALTPTQVRLSVEGRGLIDLAPEPRASWYRRQQALAMVDHFARVTRPYYPHGRVPLSDASTRTVRRCFSRCGYGAGYTGDPVMCHRMRCEEADECYAAMRQVVEATDSRAPAFVRQHQLLTGELAARGVDTPGLVAVQRMKASGVAMPFEDAVTANNELGRIDTGKWARCSSCERVPMKSVMVDGLCPRCAQEAGRA